MIKKAAFKNGYMQQKFKDKYQRLHRAVKPDLTAIFFCMAILWV